MAKKKQKISKAKKKQTEDPWPRITLQSRVADVVRVIEPIVQSYRLMRPVDLEQAIRFISGGHSTSIHTYCFEFEEPIIDRVCDWLRKNNKDLYDQVYPRWQRLTNLIERTDQFILDALETKGLNRILSDTGTNDNLRQLFVSIKHFAAILEDTANNLRENTTRKNKPKKRGHGKLNEQVGELLDRLQWPIDIEAPKIKEILNTENADIYSNTSADSIRKTQNWIKLQRKKQKRKKK